MRFAFPPYTWLVYAQGYRAGEIVGV